MLDTCIATHISRLDMISLCTQKITSYLGGYDALTLYDLLTYWFKYKNLEFEFSEDWSRAGNLQQLNVLIAQQLNVLGSLLIKCCAVF